MVDAFAQAQESAAIAMGARQKRSQNVTYLPHTPQHCFSAAPSVVSTALRLQANDRNLKCSLLDPWRSWTSDMAFPPHAVVEILSAWQLCRRTNESFYGHSWLPRIPAFSRNLTRRPRGDSLLLPGQILFIYICTPFAFDPPVHSNGAHYLPSELYPCTWLSRSGTG